MEDFETPNEKPKKDKKDKKNKKASKSIETMFRTTLANHIELSNMADQKAGLMISVNAIVISIMISFLISQFDDNPRLIAPTFLLVMVCLLTITFAILATKPSVKSAVNRLPEDLDLLFFGDYTALSLDEYKAAMKSLIDSEKDLRDQLISNIYAQGKVLNRKYQRLKVAYTIFMVGFPIVIVVYLLVLSKLF